MIGCAVDNDILLKGTYYQLLTDLLRAAGEGQSCGVLGQARYVVGKRLRKRPPSLGADAAVSYLERALGELDVIEPSPEEIAAAADLELAAQKIPVALDSGESLLAAVVTSRKIALLFTGDKRAIGALERLLEQEVAGLTYIIGRLLCLEQGVFRMLTSRLATIAACREAICKEKEADRSLSICFSCSSPEITNEQCLEGLRSYIESLRATAPRVLVSS